MRDRLQEDTYLLEHDFAYRPDQDIALRPGICPDDFHSGTACLMKCRRIVTIPLVFKLSYERNGNLYVSVRILREVKIRLGSLRARQSQKFLWVR